MPDLFASAKAVFRRANQHITDLEAAIEKMRTEQPYTVVVEYDSNFGKHLLKAKFDESASLDIACIMFDAINNFRACLDQMTDAIAVKHRGEPSNPKHFAAFPFC